MARHRSTEPVYRMDRIAAGASLIAAAALLAVITSIVGLTDSTSGMGVMSAASVSADGTITNTIPLTSTPPFDRSLPRPPLPPEATSSPPPDPAPPQKTINYTVVPGDTLWGIAQKFKVDGYEPLYSWNMTVVGQNPSLIHPGLVLVVAVS